MRYGKGFTLIELLIVVAIIAILITILAPALQTAKQLASGMVCLGNQESLITAWNMYQEENKGWLVGGMNYLPPPNGNWPEATYRWVEPPKLTPTYGGDPPAPPTNDYVHPNTHQVTQEHRENGLRGGKLWKYTHDVKAYHCPNDWRWADNPYPRNLYQTYSITGTMRGEDIRKGHNRVYAYHKIGSMKFPEDKFVFVEEGVRDQWRNSGSWMILIIKGSNGEILYDQAQWIDPLAIFHNQRSTFSFADGHATLHVYMDRFTFEFSEEGDANWSVPDPYGDHNDLEWLAWGYGGIP